MWAQGSQGVLVVVWDCASAPSALSLQPGKLTEAFKYFLQGMGYSECQGWARGCLGVRVCMCVWQSLAFACAHPDRELQTCLECCMCTRCPSVRLGCGAYRLCVQENCVGVGLCACVCVCAGLCAATQICARAGLGGDLWPCAAPSVADVLSLPSLPSSCSRPASRPPEGSEAEWRCRYRSVLPALHGALLALSPEAAGAPLGAAWLWGWPFPDSAFCSAALCPKRWAASTLSQG